WTMAWELFAARARAEQSLERVASYLVEHSQPAETVLLEPIGMIGYRSQLVVLDQAGLVSPRIAERRLQGAGWMTDVITRERPDWLVMRRGVIEHLDTFAGRGPPFRNPAERNALLARYETAVIVNEERGDAALCVLRRRG